MFFIHLKQSYPAFQWSPCGGVPGRWLWTKQGQSCLPQRVCTYSGSHTGSHAHGTRTPTRAGSTSRYLQHTANNTVTCWHISLITVTWTWLTLVSVSESHTFVVGSNEAQDVIMSEHDCLINLCFAKPRPLIPGGEDLHRHVLSSPLSPPHLPESTLTNGLLQDNGPSYSPLDQQWQTCKIQKKWCQLTLICNHSILLASHLLKSSWV